MYKVFTFKEKAMSIAINMQEAKTRLSRLVAAAVAGEDVMIANRGEPVVRLVPVRQATTRSLGFIKGKLPESFFDPLPEEEWQAWEV
jgi:prevent-host-death family protein